MPDEVSIIINNWTTRRRELSDVINVQWNDRNLFTGVVYHFLTNTLFNLDHGINQNTTRIPTNVKSITINTNTNTLVTSQVTHHLQNSPAQLQISPWTLPQHLTDLPLHTDLEPDCRPLGTGHSLPTLPHSGTAYHSPSALPHPCPCSKSTSKRSFSPSPMTPPFFRWEDHWGQKQK